MSISVQNPQASSVLTSYTLSTPSEFSVSGDPTSSSGTTIVSSSTKTFSWTLSLNTCYTGSKDITFALGGNNAAATVTITSGNSSCTAATTNSSSSSSSSGGGSSSGGTATKKTVSKITAGNSTTLTFDVLGIDLITIKVKNTVNNIEVSLKEGAKPSGAAEPSLVDADIVLYKYIDISHVNISNSDTDSAVIRFKVPQDWIKANNIDPAKIELWRYTTQWDKLPTVKATETDLNIFYEATSPGLSTFVITAKKIVETAPPIETPPSNQTANQTSPTTVETVDYTIGIISFIVLIVIIALGYFYFKKFNTEDRRVKKVKKKFDYKRD